MENLSWNGLGSWVVGDADRGVGTMQGFEFLKINKNLVDMWNFVSYAAIKVNNESFLWKPVYSHHLICDDPDFRVKVQIYKNQ